MTKLLISILSFTVAGGVFFMYTESLYNKTQELNANIVQHDQALEKAAELKKLQETLLSRFNSFKKDDTNRLQKLLPDHVDNVRLILDLDHLAGTFGMAVQNVVVSSAASESAEGSVIGTIGSGKQRYDSLTLKFSTHGSYSDFVQFMESLESSLRIVDLVSLNLTPEGQGSVLVKTATSGSNASGAAGSAQREPGLSYKYDIIIRTYWLR
jgi:Tfp pilus assembly protein PilO